jgi:hypothetical protein
MPRHSAVRDPSGNCILLYQGQHPGTFEGALMDVRCTVCHCVLPTRVLPGQRIEP